MNIPYRVLFPRITLALAFWSSPVLRAEAPLPALRNPSFEVAGEKPKEIPGWGVWGGGIDRVDQWKPTHSGEAMVGYKHWVIRDASDSGLFQDVDTASFGSKYEFSVWVYVDQTKDRAFGGIELRLESTVDNRQVTVASNTMASPDIPSGRWVKLSVRGTAPVSNLRVLVVFFPSVEEPRGGAVKIDDAQITKLP